MPKCHCHGQTVYGVPIHPFIQINPTPPPKKTKHTDGPTPTCHAMSMGMAKPIPSEYSSFIELMPTTSPSRFTSGPPEFPALMAASVWMYSARVCRRPSSDPKRATAETIPTVTVLARPCLSCVWLVGWVVWSWGWGVG